ncbi:hypothetical protein [Streptomyces sp. NPDC005438]|uniref:hypothetical protein n=1 Tax=Streptomyces sp. NPDC005438 TaxID=3156880 RepID=UPI0033BDCF15
MSGSSSLVPGPPRRPKHRLLTLLIVVLLIAGPAGYLVRSGFVSRESGEDKQRVAAATGLTWQWPSQVQRRVYEVPVPPLSTYVAFYEENAWKRSSLFVQFRTSPRNLHRFLHGVGTSVSALKEDQVPISAARAQRVGWNLDRPGRDFSGVRVKNPGQRPDLVIAVDRADPQRPRVFVVSTAAFD